jgi:hypothetical protein
MDSSAARFLLLLDDFDELGVLLDEDFDGVLTGVLLSFFTFTSCLGVAPFVCFDEDDPFLDAIWEVDLDDLSLLSLLEWWWSLLLLLDFDSDFIFELDVEEVNFLFLSDGCDWGSLLTFYVSNLVSLFTFHFTYALILQPLPLLYLCCFRSCRSFRYGALWAPFSLPCWTNALFSPAV